MLLFVIYSSDTFKYRFDPKEGSSDVPALEISLEGIAKEYGQYGIATGLTMWNAAELLGTYIWENQPLFKNKTFIELGSGLGLCGIVASKIGAHVTMTVVNSLLPSLSSFLSFLAPPPPPPQDGSEETLTQMRANCAVNDAFNIQCLKLIWGGDSSMGVFDMVLGADVLYEQKAVGKISPIPFFLSLIIYVPPSLIVLTSFLL
jgi:hypothetical protein